MLNDMIRKMPSRFYGQWKPDTAADLLVKLAAVLAVLFLLAGYLALPTLPVFGHDEVHYYTDFFFKLPEDGRWLNHLLFDFSRSVPLPIWSLLYLALSWLLHYRIARSCAFDPAYCVIMASTILLVFPFVEMSLWPATTLPALGVVLLASVLQKRGVAHPLIYLGAGLVIFGTMQTYYFLLPLLFLPQFLEQAQPVRWRLLLSHMLWWVAGSVAGALFMSLLLWPMTGHFGPQPADWRNTQAVHDWASLVNNTYFVASNFIQLLENLLRLGGVTWGFILIVAMLALLRLRELLKLWHLHLLLAAMLLSFFAFSLPLAPTIDLRSLVAMATAIILFIALLPGRSATGRVVGALLLLKLAAGYSASSKEFLELHETETAWYTEKLRILIPGNPMAYTAIALHGTMDPERFEAFIFNDPSRMHPLLVSLGTRKYLDCRIEDRCEGVGTGQTLAEIPFAKGRLTFSVDAANVGIIRYSD